MKRKRREHDIYISVVTCESTANLTNGRHNISYLYVSGTLSPDTATVTFKKDHDLQVVEGVILHLLIKECQYCCVYTKERKETLQGQIFRRG